MSKVKIKREEIEKFLKDFLGVKELKWNKDGSCDTDMTLKEVRENNNVYYVPSPVYVPTPYVVPYRPFNHYQYPWRIYSGTGRISSITSSRSKPLNATYCSSSGVVK